MSNFKIIIDVFEGSGLLELSPLMDNDISRVFVRLGAYSLAGGLSGNRLDTLFRPQWELLRSNSFFRPAAYLPYNPWKNWEYNRDWTLSNIPADCKTLEADIENPRTLNYSPQSYAADFSMYIHNLPTLRTITYTGEGSLPLLSSWPKDVDYSWAQYYNSLRPSDSVNWTWAQLREKLSKYPGPSNANKVPGRLKAWQFTGDKVIVPGSKKGLDIYAWLGTDEELDFYFPPNDIPTDPPPPTGYQGGTINLTLNPDGTTSASNWR